MAVLAMASSSTTAACSSNVAGPTINWAVAVCQMRNETDDILHPEVQACVNKFIARNAIPNVPTEVCRLNTKYKAEICRDRIAAARNMSVRACTQSIETIPRVVSHGVGG
jgi:hypothetical protein